MIQPFYNCPNRLREGLFVNAVELIRRLHHHRAWVNRNLLAAAAGLSGEQLRAPFPIGQGSVWRSLVHLYAAEFNWLEALQGNDDPLLPGDLPGRLPGNQQGEGGVEGLDDLRQKWSAQEGRWADYLASLSPDVLEELVYKTSSLLGPGGRWETRRSDVLLHVCTHAHYTAAQVVNMLRQAGVDKLPETMITTLARQEGN